MIPVITDIAIMNLFMPVVAWVGLLTFTLLCVTAIVGLSLYKGWLRWPIRYHMYLAVATAAVAFIHLLLAIGYLF